MRNLPPDLSGADVVLGEGCLQNLQLSSRKASSSSSSEGMWSSYESFGCSPASSFCQVPDWSSQTLTGSKPSWIQENSDLKSQKFSHLRGFQGLTRLGQEAATAPPTVVCFPGGKKPHSARWRGTFSQHLSGLIQPSQLV